MDYCCKVYLHWPQLESRIAEYYYRLIMIGLLPSSQKETFLQFCTDERAVKVCYASRFLPYALLQRCQEPDSESALPMSLLRCNSMAKDNDIEFDYVSLTVMSVFEAIVTIQ